MNETEERKGTPPSRGQDAHATAGETPALRRRSALPQARAQRQPALRQSALLVSENPDQLRTGM
jgi:hypothetical protein